MKRLFESRDFLARLLFVAGLGWTVFAPARLDSLPPNEVETTFLDSSGNEVGYKFLGCDGTRILEGEMTPTRIYSSESCEGGGGGCAISCFVDGNQVDCDHPIVVGVCSIYYGAACNVC